MPCYEFYCRQCNKIHEVYYHWKYGDGFNYLDDPDFQVCPQDDEHGFIDLIPSRYTADPDTHWHGYYFDTTDVYSTSKSKYKKMLKERGLETIGDRTDRESLTKIAANANKEKDQKRERELDNFLVDMWAKEEFGIMGTVEERNNKVEALRRAESDSPQDVCIDPHIAELVGT